MNLYQPVADGPFEERLGGGGPMFEFDMCSDVIEYRQALAAATPIRPAVEYRPLPACLCGHAECVHTDYDGRPAADDAEGVCVDGCLCINYRPAPAIEEAA